MIDNSFLFTSLKQTGEIYTKFKVTRLLHLCNVCVMFFGHAKLDSTHTHTHTHLERLHPPAGWNYGQQSTDSPLPFLRLAVSVTLHRTSEKTLVATQAVSTDRVWQVFGVEYSRPQQLL